MEGGWQFILYAMLLFRFVIPFIVLLNRGTKHNRKVLATLSIMVLVVHYAEIYWIIMPVLTEHGFGFSWMDITSLLGLGGVFFGLFFTRFKKHSMVPVCDPKLDECLSKSYHQ
jgi:apolipoprotein N-acyltransferase